MRTCEICKKSEDQVYRIINSTKYGVLCSSCYTRERTNPITYELPKKGEIAYSPEGKPICHICGKAYNKILSHVWQVHGMSAYEYKKEFSLETSKGILSERSKELARQRIEENYDISVKKNLLDKGKATRFTKGVKGRTRDQVSMQTLKKLQKHAKKIGFKRLDKR